MRDPRFNDEQRNMIAKEILLAEESVLNTGRPNQVWFDPVENFAYITSFAEGETYGEVEAEYFERSILVLSIKGHDLRDIYGDTNTDVDWNNPEYWRTPEYEQLQQKFLSDKKEFDPELAIDIAYTYDKIADPTGMGTK